MKGLGDEVMKGECRPDEAFGPSKKTTRPHEKLECWKSAIALVVDLYKVTKDFPKEELYGLTAQIRRSAVSIPANIAEGAARRGETERKQFFYIARGSLSELETLLTIANRVGYIEGEIASKALAQCGHIAAMLNGLLCRN